MQSKCIWVSGKGVGDRDSDIEFVRPNVYTSPELTNRYYEPSGSFYLGVFLLLEIYITNT